MNIDNQLDILGRKIMKNVKIIGEIIGGYNATNKVFMS
jgi:hypothetical protein